MTNLSDIGFYTLSNSRAINASIHSPLMRCELILTSACNFKCPYCRGLQKEQKGTLKFQDALRTIKLWCEDGLQNIRFSGGEPTLYKGLVELVQYCTDHGVKRIAISTNGSAPLNLYDELIKAGVNDFSISLDGACCSIGDAMAGNITGAWDKVIRGIKHIASKTYTTVGLVFTEDNVKTAIKTVEFAASLGVSDIRIIPSAQYNKALNSLKDLLPDLLDQYPILKYRVNNLLAGNHVRGIAIDNHNRCSLVLDDMAVVKNDHYPCIIHMREGGKPIGQVGPKMRKERQAWMCQHKPWLDPICSKNCLDVCIDYNNKAAR